MEDRQINKKNMIGIGAAVGAVLIVVIVLMIVMNGGIGTPKVEPGVPHDYEKDGYIELGEYKGIKVDLTVTDEMVDEEINYALEDTEAYEHMEGTAEDASTVNVNLITKFEDGTVYEDYSSENEIITVGDEDYFAEVDAALIGMKTGETKSVKVNVPDDFGDPDLDGKNLTVDVTLNYICGAAIEAEVTDEFVKDYSEGECTSAADFRDYIKETLYNDNVESLSDTVWEEVVGNAVINKYHKGELKNATEETNKSYESFAELSGYSSKEELLESLGMTEEDVEDSINETAASKMIAKTIAVKENLTLDEEAYKNLLIDYMEYEDEADKSKPIEDIEKDYFDMYEMDPRDGMLQEYVVRYVTEQADVTGLK